MRNLSRVLAALFSFILLMACNRPDPQSPEAKDAGSARLYLPPLPAGYLAKKASGYARFVLTVSAQGKVLVKRTWSGDQLEGALVVDGIPSGPARVFKGQLFLRDSVTHEGTDSVDIHGGETADVFLYLANVGPGGARICVVIEGQPVPSGCYPRPDTSYSLSGCWRATLIGGDSSYVSASLRIIQYDSSLEGELIWPDGSRDSSRGVVYSDGEVVFSGGNGFSTWGFMGTVDSGLYLNGTFKSATHPFLAHLSAARGSCYPDTVVPPIDTIWPPIDTTRPPIDTACPNGDTVIVNEWGDTVRVCRPAAPADSVFEDPTGCWRVMIQSGSDSLLVDLSVTRTWGILQGTLTFPDGIAQAAGGYLSGNRLVFEPQGPTGWKLEAVLSNGVLEGWLTDLKHGVYGRIRAWRTYCGPLIYEDQLLK